MKKLNHAETRRAIAALGIEKPYLEAFRLDDSSQSMRYEFHAHGKHQLLSPQKGLILVETHERLHTLAPGQAAWIPAGVRHATTLGAGHAHSLFFPPNRYPSLNPALKVFALSSFARELLEAVEEQTIAPAKIRRAIFDLLHHLCGRVLQEAPNVSLPRPRSAELASVVGVMLAHLDTMTPTEMARRAGMSPRTLRRRFQAEVGLPPEKLLQQARLTRAMQLLKERPSAGIAEVALEVGYESQSAFGSAFRQFTGRSPAVFRRE